MLKKVLFLLAVSIFISVAAKQTAPQSPKAAEPKAAKPAKKVVKVDPLANAAKLPALKNPQSWSMVIVPDTQTYVKQIENQGILDLMLAWIVRRREEMNLQQVLFTGDLVYSNNVGDVEQLKGVRFYKGGRLRDLVGSEQWQAFSRLLERLDGEVPYILCTGNHDHGNVTAENRKSLFNEYFPTNRNPLTRRQLLSCSNNGSGVKTLENAAYEFTAPHPDNRKFLVISLQFAPSDNDLKWAKKIVDNPKYANHFGIVLTHSYMNGACKRALKENYAVNRKGGNAGEAIFQKLVYPAKNIRLVVCGHMCAPDDWKKSVAFSMDKNSSGKSVAQMLFNTQAIGGGFSGSGGDGWLRILEFMPDRKTIRATTYSPFFGSSPSTGHLAWKTDERNEFTFVLE